MLSPSPKMSGMRAIARFLWLLHRTLQCINKYINNKHEYAVNNILLQL